MNSKEWTPTEWTRQTHIPQRGFDGAADYITAAGKYALYRLVGSLVQRSASLEMTSIVQYSSLDFCSSELGGGGVKAESRVGLRRPIFTSVWDEAADHVTRVSSDPVVKVLTLLH